METPMDLQKLTFFTEGNTFTGSRTKDAETGKLLRYLVRPDKEEGQLLAYAWKTDICFERAQDKEEKSFSMSESGLEEIQKWLQTQFEAL